MNILGFNLPKRRSLMHAAIGSGICFLVMFILSDIGQIGLQNLLAFIGCMGVTAFRESFTIARAAFLFGVVYLASGFCGGLYTGYNVEEDLRTVLAMPGIIGFLGLNILSLFFGSLTASGADLAADVFLPLVGSVIGAYLGGYTMNWPPAKEVPEAPEKLTLELGRGRPRS